jgi:predicted ArsR family transcriptional regulator
MLDAFKNVKNRAEEAQGEGAADKSSILRTLTPKQRKILTLFETSTTITSKDVEGLFGFSTRAARFLLKNLVENEFLKIANKADKTRTYRLSEEYESLTS